MIKPRNTRLRDVIAAAWPTVSVVRVMRAQKL
jgi:hypothetical protein